MAYREYNGIEEYWDSGRKNRDGETRGGNIVSNISRKDRRNEKSHSRSRSPTRDDDYHRERKDRYDRYEDRSRSTSKDDEYDRNRYKDETYDRKKRRYDDEEDSDDDDRRRRRRRGRDEKRDKKRRDEVENHYDEDNSSSRKDKEESTRRRRRRGRDEREDMDDNDSDKKKYKDRRSQSPSRRRRGRDDEDSYRKEDNDNDRRTTTTRRRYDDDKDTYNDRPQQPSSSSSRRRRNDHLDPIRRPYHSIESPQPPQNFEYHYSQSPKPPPHYNNNNNNKNFGYRTSTRDGIRRRGNYGNRSSFPSTSTYHHHLNQHSSSSSSSSSSRKIAKTVPSPREIQIRQMKFFKKGGEEEREDDPNIPDFNTKYFKIEGKWKNRWISPREKERRKKMFSSTISVLERYKFEKRVIVENLSFVTEKHRKIYDENPHLRSLFTNRSQLFRTHRVLGETQEDRIIDFENSPRSPYRRRGKINHTVDHWGQRKLLLSEIEFLTRFYNQSSSDSSLNNVLIYAGAAPGKHIPFLLDLFPKLRMVLIDPAKFKIEENDRIEIINDYFTDKMAEDFRYKYVENRNNNNNNVLFISDVRGDVDRPSNYDTFKEQEKVSHDVDVQVTEDMKMQHRWFDLLRPHSAMMKFRLSYYPGTTRYLLGEVYFPIFTGKSSSEARMMVKGGINDNITWPAPTILYDHSIYENIMFHFHSVTRTSYFEHDIVDGEGLDHCYDCSAEIFVLSEYFKRVQGIQDIVDVNKKVVKLSKKISREISKGKNVMRTLSIDCFKEYKKFFDEIL